MANNPTKNRYALDVGHIAIEWNYLEHDLQLLGFAYLTVEEDVASHIFGFMGNVTKVEFIEYLVDRYEKNKEIKGHLKHFLKIYNRLRGNRNVVEHGIPALTQSGAYLDKIIKIDRRGDAMPFAASQDTLNGFLKDLHRAREYATAIKSMIDLMGEDRENVPGPEEYDRPMMPPRLKSLPFGAKED
jgi:hypothetical protein